MTTLSNWYNSQYSTWNRTRRLRVTPYLARTDTMTSRTATAMANRTQTAGAVIVNTAGTGTVAASSSNSSNGKSKDGKKQEALFGPNIGVVNSGPAWTDITDKKVMAEELTPEVVQSWIARSKESSQPTTTLQALVNLKRPTLRLSPLTAAPNDDPSHIDSQHHHGLEFEYDCDAPKCGIYVHVLLSHDHPLAESNPAQSRVLVFETVTEGGFGKFLKIEEGATLELGRFESKRRPPASALAPHTHIAAAAAPTAEGEAQSSTTDIALTSSRETSARPATSDTTSNRRGRFSTFHFRRRTHNRSISGPALAVVDAEVPSTAAGAKSKDIGKDELGEEGVKVTIRLAALDEQGTELSLPNEQVTYLHVVRFGAPPAENQEDTRSWVVKVVKREATIGPHTFHLHEIYGLTSTTTHSAAPTTTSGTTSIDVHTYPPPPAASSVAAAVAHHLLEDEPSSECLLCLSSPREVVLLPCRHLVACKECALNMVEFGAGGSITQPEAETTAAAAAPPATATADTEPTDVAAATAPVDVDGTIPTEATAAATTSSITIPTTMAVAPSNGTSAAAAPVTPVTSTAVGATTTVTVATTTATTTTARRKRKAKGWFCPVCRQPYTSLLRITTTSPIKDPDHRPSLSLSEEPAPVPVSEAPLQALTVTVPPPTVNRGGLSAFRPAFLRNFSRTPAATTAPDLERGVASA